MDRKEKRGKREKHALSTFSTTIFNSTRALAKRQKYANFHSLRVLVLTIASIYVSKFQGTTSGRHCLLTCEYVSVFVRVCV